MFLRVITLLLLTLFATACGQKKSDGTARMIQRGQLEEGVDPFVGEQTLECSASDGQCPEAVGRLLTVFPDNSYSSCTGFLVTPQIIMTNSHCVELASADYCEKTRFIVRTGKAGKTKVLRCSEVLLVNPLNADETHNDGDYAFVKLAESTTLRPLTVETSLGVAEGQSYAIWSIDAPQGETPRVVRRDCEAVQRTVVLPHFENDHSSIVSLINCPIIPGNSGSPILNSAGQAVAIAYAGNEQDVADAHPILQGRRVALGVNFSCVIFPGLAAFNGSSCSQMDIRGAGRRVQAELSTQLQNELQRTVDAWVLTAPEELRAGFEWGHESNGANTWTPVPVCAKGSEEILEFKNSFPTWSTRSITDAQLRPRPELMVALTSELKFFAWKGETQSDPWVFSIEGDDELSAITQEIPRCD